LICLNLDITLLATAMISLQDTMSIIGMKFGTELGRDNGYRCHGSNITSTFNTTSPVLVLTVLVLK